jgi:hypothetical protein
VKILQVALNVTGIRADSTGIVEDFCKTAGEDQPPAAAILKKDGRKVAHLEVTMESSRQGRQNLRKAANFFTLPESPVPALNLLVLPKMYPENSGFQAKIPQGREPPSSESSLKNMPY